MKIMKIDYIAVTLTKSEKKLLKRIASSKEVAINDLDANDLHTLLQLKLIKENYTNELDSIGNFISLNTVSIAKDYERYKSVKRTLFIERKLPIIISIIALLSSFRAEILWLIQAIMQLLK